MSLVLPRMGRAYDLEVEERRNDLLERADRQNFKKTGDVDHPHSLTVRAYTQGSITRTITASTTQSQGQQPLTTQSNLVETVANASDVVTLPEAVAGRLVEIVNQGANTLQIFPASGYAIDGGAADASVTLAASASVTFRAFDATDWYTVA